MKKTCICLYVLASIIAFSSGPRAEEAPTSPELIAGIPVKDTVTLVDLGAKTCIPCKMMAPILNELKTEYQGRAEVIFIDVHEKPEAAEPFKLTAIPTQIIYDRQGKEAFRHVGFLDKNGLKKQLDQYLQVQ